MLAWWVRITSLEETERHGGRAAVDLVKEKDAEAQGWAGRAYYWSF